jgi:hypothetical protein
MDKNLTKSFIFIFVGLSLFVLNKPLGKVFQFWQNRIVGNDYDLWSFRFPVLFIGLLFTGIGIASFFF